MTSVLLFLLEHSCPEAAKISNLSPLAPGDIRQTEPYR